MDEKKKAAEEKYLCTDLSLKALAAEMDVKYGTMLNWCKTGGWVKKKKSVAEKALQKAAAKAVNKKARELCRLLEASDEVEDALLQAAKAIARNIEADAEGLLVTDGKERAGNLTRITQALGRQAQTRMLLSGIMTAEDQERIKLMRRKQEMEERKEKQALEEKDGSVVVRLEGMAEEMGE